MRKGVAGRPGTNPNNLQLRIRRQSSDRAVDVRLRGKFAAHRIQRNAHASLFLGIDQRTALVETAIRTDNMRGHSRPTLRTMRQLHRLECIAGSPFTAAGLRNLTLGNSHASPA